MKTPDEFWNKFEKLSNDCWVLPNTDVKTYYTVKWFNRVIAAHRLSAYLSGKLDSLESKQFVLHTCDNKRCCNPKHLEVGGYSKNITDAYRRKLRSSKLDLDKANEIRYKFKQGVNQVELANLYSVSQACISKVINNKIYC